MSGFVYVIESPSAADLADGRTEGRSLCETFKLSGTSHEYRLTVNIEQFKRALDVTDLSSPILRSIREGVAPIIHLSMHGNEECIQLTDGSCLGWQELYQVLKPLNDLLPDGLLVTFSTCGGGASIRMNMSEAADHKPLYATVGSFASVPWSDALVAYTVFYHNWFKGENAGRCVELMKAASGHEGFVVYSGPDQKRSYIEFAQRQRLVTALTSGSLHSGISLGR